MLNKSTLSPPVTQNSTLNPAEVAKFDQLAKEWWDPEGKMKTALAFNRARLAFIQTAIINHFNRVAEAEMPLSGLSLLDVGSGGGLLSEPLAQAGAEVTGIDASAVSVEVAKRHAAINAVQVTYLHKLSSDLVTASQRFDVVINAEVVEHVADQKRLIEECCELVKPGGLLVLATLNKTLKSFVIAILGAEYILRYLPIGTHDWRYFVKPATLSKWTEAKGFKPFSETGMKLNPFTGNWRHSTDLSVNYVQCFRK